MYSQKTWCPSSAGLYSTHPRYEALVAREEKYNKTHGNRFVIRKPIEAPDYKEGEEYTKAQLQAMADKILRDDSRSEVCRECGDRGIETGIAEQRPQDAYDGQGNQLILEFAQLVCEEGHTWWEGEGQVRGIDGDNPILFEEHFASRRKREIYTTIGTPDPSIVAGIYNRTHPQGRRVNSEEQRKRNGASYYA